MVIYNSMVEAAEALPMEERPRLFAAAVYYASTGIEPRLDDPMANAIFVSHKPLLKTQYNKMQKSCSLPNVSDATKSQLAKGNPLQGKPYEKDFAPKQSGVEGSRGEYPPIAPQGASSGKNLAENDVKQQVAKGEPLQGKPSDSYAEQRREVVSYLNGKIGTGFKPGTADTKKHIDARLREGFTVDDFKAVIDNRVSEWGSDPRMRQYLRPATLFNSAKFEGYLNASRQSTTTRGGYSGDYSEYD